MAFFDFLFGKDEKKKTQVVPGVSTPATPIIPEPATQITKRKALTFPTKKETTNIKNIKRESTIDAVLEKLQIKAQQSLPRSEAEKIVDADISPQKQFNSFLYKHEKDEQERKQKSQIIGSTELTDEEAQSYRFIDTKTLATGTRDEFEAAMIMQYQKDKQNMQDENLTIISGLTESGLGLGPTRAFLNLIGQKGAADITPASRVKRIREYFQQKSPKYLQTLSNIDEAIPTRDKTRAAGKITGDLSLAFIAGGASGSTFRGIPLISKIRRIGTAGSAKRILGAGISNILETVVIDAAASLSIAAINEQGAKEALDNVMANPSAYTIPLLTGRYSRFAAIAGSIGLDYYMGKKMGMDDHEALFNGLIGGFGKTIDISQFKTDLLAKAPPGFIKEGKTIMENFSSRAQNFKDTPKKVQQIWKETETQMKTLEEKYQFSTGESRMIFTPEGTKGGRKGIEKAGELPEPIKKTKAEQVLPIKPDSKKLLPETPKETKKIQEVEKQKTLQVSGEKPKTVDEIVAQNVAKREDVQKKPDVIKRIKSSFKEFKEKIIDQFSPIEDPLRKIRKEVSIRLEFDPSDQFDKVMRSEAVADDFMKQFGFNKIIQRTKNTDELSEYLIATHAKDLEKLNIKTGRNLTEDQFLIDNASSQTKKEAKNVTQFTKTMMDTTAKPLEEGGFGLVSTKNAEVLKTKYKNYVPSNRIFGEGELQAKTDTIPIDVDAQPSIKSTIKNIKGSKRTIEDPLISIIKNTGEMFHEGEKNRAAWMVVQTHKLPGNPLSLKRIDNSDTNMPNTFSYLNNGVKETWETTPEIVNAIKSLKTDQMGTALKIASTMNRIFKAGTTGIRAAFATVNLPKDQITGLINSDFSTRFAISLPRAVWSSFRHDALYRRIVKNAALNANMFDIGRPKQAQTIASIKSTKSKLSRASYVVRHPKDLFRAIENIFGRFEDLTRIQQFIATESGLKASGRTARDAELLAVRAARGSTGNFLRFGSAGRVINIILPYLNASKEVIRSTIRAAEKNPAKFAGKLALLIGTPIATITMWNLSDDKRKEAYDDIEEYEKKGNIIWIPPNPQKDENGDWIVVKIPVGQNLLSMTAPLRRSIEAANGLDPIAIKDIIQDLNGAVNPVPLPLDKDSARQTANAIIPQQIKPVAEALAGVNLFTGAPIVPTHLQKAAPADQFKKRTTETTKAISPPGISPAHLENFLRGYFGPLSTDILGTSDNILEQLGVIDEAKGSGMGENVIKRLLRAKGGAQEYIDIKPPAAKDIFSKLAIKEAKKADITLLPPYLNGSFTYKTKKIPLSQKQYNTFSEEYGETFSIALAKISKNPIYKKASTENKNKIIMKIKSKTLAATKEKFIKNNLKDILPFLTQKTP